MSKYDIAIIGGGAAGLAAAVAASQVNPSLRTVLFEKNDRVGKKLASTGNGRCNVSNVNMGAEYFHSQTPDFVARVLRAFDTTQLTAFFKGLGLYLTEEEGRLYPYSQRAASVIDVLRMSMPRVQVRTGVTLDTLYDISARKIIVATGGLAAPHTGSSGEGYKLLKWAGHTIEPPYPALTPLTIKHPFLSTLKNIRVQPCRVRLGDAEAIGEVQFTANGLSGIPVMEVSRAMAGKETAIAYLDVLPHWTDEEVRAYVQERMKKFPQFPHEEFFTGLFHRRVGQALLGCADTPEELCALLKSWPFAVTGAQGFIQAQVTGGGARLSEFSPSDMQSLKQFGLFAAGEVLDVFGDCGGYNLHWAFATGYLAGQGAAWSCGL